MKGFYQMNSELLAAFLKDHNGFEGSAFELYTKLKYRPEFRTLPACGEDFVLELRRQVPEMKGRDVDVACSLDGDVHIKIRLSAIPILTRLRRLRTKAMPLMK
jgi:hypothetical protein